MTKPVLRVPSSDETAGNNGLGRITVLEALAQVTPRIGLSRSNQSTPSAGDADDQ
jgi:hypothetical protein